MMDELLLESLQSVPASWLMSLVGSWSSRKSLFMEHHYVHAFELKSLGSSFVFDPCKTTEELVSKLLEGSRIHSKVDLIQNAQFFCGTRNKVVLSPLRTCLRGRAVVECEVRKGGVE